MLSRFQQFPQTQQRTARLLYQTAHLFCAVVNKLTQAVGASACLFLIAWVVAGRCISCWLHCACWWVQQPLTAWEAHCATSRLAPSPWSWALMWIPDSQTLSPPGGSTSPLGNAMPLVTAILAQHCSQSQCWLNLQNSNSHQNKPCVISLWADGLTPLHSLSEL